MSLEQAAITSLNSINQFFFVMQKQSYFREAGARSGNIIWMSFTFQRASTPGTWRVNVSLNKV